MNLRRSTAEREFPPCPLKSSCRRKADKKFFTGLFDQPWEVFVIRRDPATNKYDWSTHCCDAVVK
jgi:hypothetical protein